MFDFVPVVVGGVAGTLFGVVWAAPSYGVEDAPPTWKRALHTLFRGVIGGVTGAALVPAVFVVVASNPLVGGISLAAILGYGVYATFVDDSTDRVRGRRSS